MFGQWILRTINWARRRSLQGSRSSERIHSLHSRWLSNTGIYRKTSSALLQNSTALLNSAV